MTLIRVCENIFEYNSHELLFNIVNVNQLLSRKHTMSRGILQFWTIFRSSQQNCSIKKLFLKILQYSKENTYVGVSF